MILNYIVLLYIYTYYITLHYIVLYYIINILYILWAIRFPGSLALQVSNHDTYRNRANSNNVSRFLAWQRERLVQSWVILGLLAASSQSKLSSLPRIVKPKKGWQWSPFSSIFQLNPSCFLRTASRPLKWSNDEQWPNPLLIKTLSSRKILALVFGKFGCVPSIK